MRTRQRTLRKFRGFGVLIVAIGFAWYFSTALPAAHEGATGVVKQRMEAMKSLQEATREILEMIRRKRQFDAARIADLSGQISHHADDLAKLFPKGSGGHPSEALPSIWSDWTGFVEQMQAMKRAAGELAKAAAQGERRDVIRAFAKLGRTCTACHTDFRKAK